MAVCPCVFRLPAVTSDLMHSEEDNDRKAISRSCVTLREYYWQQRVGNHGKVHRIKTTVTYRVFGCWSQILKGTWKIGYEMLEERNRNVLAHANEKHSLAHQ